MRNGAYITEKCGESFSTMFRVEKILHDARSVHQRITVADIRGLGRALFLDENFNVGPFMEAHYHEPMAHIPIAMLDGDRLEALIIGGGDFGVASHLLKHPSLKRLDLCELDPEVLAVCRKYFPQWAEAEKDPRARVHVGDGFDYLRQCPPDGLDVIIVDSTDPFLHGGVLISDEFYARASRSLKSGGVLMQIVADHILFREVWNDVIPAARPHFPALAPIFLPIPFYATGAWGLMLAAREPARLDPFRVSAEYLKSIPNLKTLTPELVRGWFSLPPVVERELGPLLRT